MNPVFVMIYNSRNYLGFIASIILQRYQKTLYKGLFYF